MGDKLLDLLPLLWGLLVGGGGGSLSGLFLIGSIGWLVFDDGRVPANIFYSSVVLGGIIGLLVYIRHKAGGRLVAWFCLASFGLLMLTAIVGNLRQNPDDWGVLFMILLGLPALAVGIYFFEANRRSAAANDDDYVRVWHKFARKYRLGFTPPGYFRAGRVRGDYKIYQLTLKQIRRENLLARLLGDFQGQRGVMALAPNPLARWLRQRLAASMDDPDVPVALDELLGSQRYTQMSLTASQSAVVSGVQESPLLTDSHSRQDIIDRFFQIDPLPGKFYAFNQGQKISCEQKDVVVKESDLKRMAETLRNLMVSYPLVVALGGEIIPRLERLIAHDDALVHVASQALADIGQETTIRLQPQADQLLCSDCLVHCYARPATVPWGNVTYYGCRECGQSRRFLAVENRPVIALLDQNAPPQQQTSQAIRVNWLSRRELFDFDVVEIVQASDEAVERFAVQVGNDTDIVRQDRYQEVVCRIAPTCELSENSRRILARTFGTVES